MTVTNEGFEGNWSHEENSLSQQLVLAQSRIVRLLSQRSAQLDVINDLRAELHSSEEAIKLRDTQIEAQRLSLTDLQMNVRSGQHRTPARGKAYEAIDSERDFQEQQELALGWAEHQLGAYLTLLQVYVTKAQAAWCGESGHQQGLAGVRKVAAIAVACMENHGAPVRE